MKKSVVLYKKLSAPLMARLHEQAEVTLIEALDEAGIEIPFPHQVEVPAKDAKFARVVMAPIQDSAVQGEASDQGRE